jgi:hypothetical protein
MKSTRRRLSLVCDRACDRACHRAPSGPFLGLFGWETRPLDDPSVIGRRRNPQRRRQREASSRWMRTDMQIACGADARAYRHGDRGDHRDAGQSDETAPETPSETAVKRVPAAWQNGANGAGWFCRLAEQSLSDLSTLLRPVRTTICLSRSDRSVEGETPTALPRQGNSWPLREAG